MRYTDEEIIRAIDSAPPAVRSAVSSAKTARTIADIGSQYKLHIDVIGTLAQLNRNMLVGLMSPAEVLGELVYKDVPAEAAKGILTELNKRIFVPIQQQIRSGEETTPAPARMEFPTAPAPLTPRDVRQETVPAPPAPAVPNVPALPEHDSIPEEMPVVQAAAPAPTPHIERSAPRPVRQPLVPPPSIPETIVPRAPQPVPPPTSPPSYIREAVTALEEPETPPRVLPGQEPINRMAASEPTPLQDDGPAGYITRTMARDMTALKEGKSPFEIAHPEPLPSPEVPPAPVKSPEPQPSRPVPPREMPTPKPVPHVSPQPTVSQAPRAVSKQYAADPYREPIE
ncbi:MAG TPA: hypothetical protein VFY28_00715 [Candidatus Paceibacterota bacterium]|nr:hypothetical protein [Candidatus Paceibacterota bacterium]